MAKIKKTFDRELMYKKIMPTNLKRETEQVQDAPVEYAPNIPEKNNSKETIFQNKELNLIKEEKNNVILYNVTEKLVLNKLDATLKKMNCCRCDRCKEDIIAIALNNLKPMYMVATKDEITQKIHEIRDIGSEVTTEVIKAVLTVRKNPRH
ncbi:MULTISPECIES: late competence development ComFB family protein [unclassified Sedimentibacter]|uniref:late competence development ComFB family protein n=1 Tax=unclassified Sedimentibacter TaxID=2649220 RepID=UPI0027E0B743|nr:late competence development ComFB family protein [Sedimentibacter sp. MB35-C1]WMJ78581.1 late competence development ComFB family protein [Sedimentibacter sp. MB35-C1]